MGTGIAAGATSQAWWPRLIEVAVVSDGVSEESHSRLRVGVERGMVATVAVAAPLLVLQSLPTFAAERAAGSPLVAISLVLVALQCLFLPAALLRRGRPAYLWMHLSVFAYLCLMAIERLETRTTFPSGFTPWLAGVACIAFSALAIGTRRAPVAAAGSAVIVAGVLAAYVGRVYTGHLVVAALGLAAMASGLILGVRALRRRADSADRAERAAAERFAASRRLVALEDERIRTDALLHDSVLNTLLIAAAGLDDLDRTVLMAENALAVVSDTTDGPRRRRSLQTFEQAVAAAEREFVPMRGLVELDLAAAHAVQVPEGVGDTLVAAMLQALSNSIKHAGPMAVRVATAIPLAGGGLRISVCDDGRGFDMSAIASERLGVRVSILERVRLAGGTAEIRSGRGTGTTVTLEWTPAEAGAEHDLRQPVLV